MLSYRFFEILTPSKTFEIFIVSNASREKRERERNISFLSTRPGDVENSREANSMKLVVILIREIQPEARHQALRLLFRSIRSATHDRRREAINLGVTGKKKGKKNKIKVDARKGVLFLGGWPAMVKRA